MVVARDCGMERMRNYCLIGMEFEFYKMKRSTEMDGDGIYTTL
jgi:hypothetical protein